MRALRTFQFRDRDNYEARNNGDEGSGSGNSEWCKKTRAAREGSPSDQMLWIYGATLETEDGEHGGGAACKEGQPLARDG